MVKNNHPLLKASLYLMSCMFKQEYTLEKQVRNSFMMTHNVKSLISMWNETSRRTKQRAPVSTSHLDSEFMSPQ